VAIAEMEIVVGAGISGEPIFAVNLLAVGYKPRHQVLVALLADVRHALSTGLDDLKVLIVHPDASLKIPFVLLDAFGRHVEHVRIDFVYTLSADIEDVVLRQVLRGHDKRHFVTNVLEVLSAHGDPDERRLRREGYILNTISLIVVGDIRGFSKFTIDGVAL